MHRVAVLSLFVVVGLCSLASAQQWADKMFKVRSHDFGTVARNSDQVFEFELQNVYKEDIHIANVRASCGCTTPSITKQTLKTWEKGAIRARFNTGSFLGSKTATLTVVIDRPYRAEVQLNVQGYIRSDVVFNPGAIEFGEVAPGGSIEKKVNLAYAGRNDWKITDIRSNHEHVEVAMAETGRGGGRVNYQLTVRLTEGAPAGYFKDHLYVLTNDGRKAIPLAMSGRVRPAVTISPASLFMGAVDQGQEVTKQLVVRAQQPFRVVNIRCDDGCFKFQPSDEAKNLHLIPVSFTGNKAGKVACRIVIETDLPAGNAEFVASATVSDSQRVASGN